MNDKLRSVNTKFWDDPFIEELNSEEKLLFLYLLTNPATNLLGIYQITLKRISYHTGMNLETIRKGFERFRTVRKVFYTDNDFVILPNWLKNQRLNDNMKKAVVKEFNELPTVLKNNILGNHSEPLVNDFEWLRNSMVKYEIEIEEEIEEEIEKRKGSKNLSKNISTDFIDQIVYLFTKAHGSYKIISPGKERAAAGKLLKFYKEKFPNQTAKQTLDGLEEYFRLCVNIDDPWLRDNMSPSMIVSKYNTINKIINEGKSYGKKNNAGITEEQIDRAIEKGLGVIR